MLGLFINNGSHGWRASCVLTTNFRRLQEVEFHSIKGTLSSMRQLLETEEPLKMMKNAFYFTFWFSWYLNFCLEFSVMSKNGLTGKIRLISNFMTSQPGWWTIAIHILTNISRSKSHRAMTFGQLMDRNMKNMLFLKNQTQNAIEILFPDRFFKNQNWAYIWINILKFHTAYFYGTSNWGLSEHIETKLQATSFYLIKLF